MNNNLNIEKNQNKYKKLENLVSSNLKDIYVNDKINNDFNYSSSFEEIDIDKLNIKDGLMGNIFNSFVNKYKNGVILFILKYIFGFLNLFIN